MDDAPFVLFWRSTPVEVSSAFYVGKLFLPRRGLSVKFMCHGFAKQGIQPGLIAFPLAFQPVQYIRVDADGDLCLGRTEKASLHGVLPAFSI